MGDDFLYFQTVCFVNKEISQKEASTNIDSVICVSQLVAKGKCCYLTYIHIYVYLYIEELFVYHAEKKNSLKQGEWQAYVLSR